MLLYFHPLLFACYMSVLRYPLLFCRFNITHQAENISILDRYPLIYYLLHDGKEFLRYLSFFDNITNLLSVFEYNQSAFLKKVTIN